MKKLIIIDDHIALCNGIKLWFEQNAPDWQILFTLSDPTELEQKLSACCLQNGNLQDVYATVDIAFDKNPEIDGYDIINKLNSFGIKSVVYSMYYSGSFISRAVECKAKGFVSKNFDESELFTAFKQIDDGEEFYLPKELSDSLSKALSKTSSLSKKEKDVLFLIQKDLENFEIASRLGISIRTVENHISRIYDKTGYKTRIDLKRLT